LLILKLVVVVKFLIIRFSSIGDIVLTTPVIRCLKQQVEDSQIHYLTKKSFLGVLENNPYIDKTHILQDNFNATIAELKKEEFDYIIDLHHNLRTFRIKRRLKLLSFSFNKLNFEKWLLVNFKINKMPQKHIVDRYLDTTSLFDVENDNKGLDYFIAEKDEVNSNDLPEEYRLGYVAFVIGAKHATKQLPVIKIISVCNKINKPIILLGGKEDETNGDFIKSNSRGTILNACGKYNLNQSASLVNNAKVVITHDTGLMHIAAAFKKNIVSVWGNTVSAFGMYPYQCSENAIIIEVKDLLCRPCSKIGFDKCPKKHFRCMNEISEDVITKSVLQFWG